VRQAVELPPAEAMRPEPPAEFRPTFVERMGWQQLFSPVGRIILRNLERQPVKAGLTMLGLALAVAILVVGRSFEDAIDYIVVGAVQPDSAGRHYPGLYGTPVRSARYDVRHLPGVIRAEPFRAVPARLRFEQRTYLGGMTGLPTDPTLRR
jgi:putative ABC transport system permease protein